MASREGLPNASGDDKDELIEPRRKDGMQGFTTLMWLVASLFILMEVELKENFTGVNVGMPMVQVVLMLISTIMMTKGLNEECWPFIVPWVVISSSHCYSTQFLDIVKIYKIFLERKMTYLPWATLGLYGVSLILRIYIIFAVLLLSLQQWYNRQLRRAVPVDQ